jgi:hypothetical protein
MYALSGTDERLGRLEGIKIELVLLGTALLNVQPANRMVFHFSHQAQMKLLATNYSVNAGSSQIATHTVADGLCCTRWKNTCEQSITF